MMAGLLSLTLTYDPTPPVYRRGAVTTLKVATSLIKLLQAIEKQETKKRARLIWDINIYSFSDRAVIEVQPIGDAKTGAWARRLIQASGIDPAVLDGVEQR